MRKRLLTIMNTPDDDTLKTLLELIVYASLSHTVGQLELCGVDVDYQHDETTITTGDTVYRIPTDLYIDLYLQANEVIANIYKLIDRYVISVL